MIKLNLMAFIAFLTFSAVNPGFAATKFKQSYFVADGQRIYFESAGQGSTIVFLAGGPGADPVYMKTLIVPFVKSHRCVLLHQRGTGLSKDVPVNADFISIDKLVADLEQLRLVLNVGKIILVGHSWGGMLAMAYAGKYPDRIEKLILLDSGGCDISFFKAFNQRIMNNLTMEERSELALIDRMMGNPDSLKTYFQAGNTSQAFAEAFKRLEAIIVNGYFYDRSNIRFFTQNMGEGINFQVNNLLLVGELSTQKWDICDEFQKFRRPVLILEGSDDPVKSADVLHNIFPHSTVRYIPKSGHLIWYENFSITKRLISAFIGGN